MFLILKITVLWIVFLVDTVVYECVALHKLNVTPAIIENLKIDKDDFKFNDVLYLTPYIEDDRIEDAIADSEVKKLPDIGNRLKSYSGFLTVNKKFNSNLFFWFFPPQTKDSYAPVLVWVSGGPGDASVRGLFVQNGPIFVDANGNPSLKNYTWNREFAMLYIDQPVGTGFSFTDSDDGYARDSNDAARDLYEALRQFFTIFYDYRPNALYLTGYSYACKFHAALANRILEMNKKPATKIKMNLQGVAIGGGFCDPRHHYDVADYIYQTGLIDTHDYAYYWLRQMDYLRFISQEKWTDAGNAFHDLYYGYAFDRRPEGSYMHNVTGYESLESILYTREDFAEFNAFRQYLDRRDTRRAIHVGRRPFNSPADKVARTMFADISQSATPQIEQLLNSARVRILFYNGNLDLTTPLPAMKNVMRNLQWNGSQKYLDAPRQIYRIHIEHDIVDRHIIAGYVRQADNLIFVSMRNAGHMTELDEPVVTLDMITRFVKRIGFDSETNAKI